MAGNTKGYRFTYDGLSRLKNAIYGEGNGLATDINRFNEQITGYDKMGNIHGLLRYGQTSQADYGLIDNLNLTYSGNQLQTVRGNATNSVFGNGMGSRHILGNLIILRSKWFITLALHRLHPSETPYSSEIAGEGTPSTAFTCFHLVLFC